MYNKYNVKDIVRFDQHIYPDVTKELEALHQSIAFTPGNHKGDMIISFLKDHCLKTEWIASNRELAKILTSRSQPTSHLESIFESSQTNKLFLEDFETYIRGVCDKSLTTGV